MTVALAYLAGRVLARHPLLNASVEGDAARLHAARQHRHRDGRRRRSCSCRCCATCPRTLDELAREFARLRDAVRAREIVPADMRGGTFTISNLGMYGVDAFTAIINPPRKRDPRDRAHASTRRSGATAQIVLRPMATFTLSSDHRIVDGVTAARFMADLREAIEHPEGLS